MPPLPKMIDRSATTALMRIMLRITDLRYPARSPFRGRSEDIMRATMITTVPQGEPWHD
jgi:hypothetical protein